MKRSIVFAALAGCVTVAGAEVIDFEDLAHGDIVNNQYASSGVTISAINPNRSFDLAGIFDTTQTNTADRDLEDSFSGGNLNRNTFLGNILIIQENDNGIPDDEGSRAAGQLIFDFSFTASTFGFDVVDLEDVVAENTSLDFFLNGVLVDTIEFEDLEVGGSSGADMVFGNNSINRMAEYTVVGGYDRAVFNVGGSMGFDNINYNIQVVPLPGSAAFALFGLGGLATIKRFRR